MPGRTRIVPPGEDASTAAWIDCPGWTTIVEPADAPEGKASIAPAATEKTVTARMPRALPIAVPFRCPLYQSGDVLRNSYSRCPVGANDPSAPDAPAGRGQRRPR